jgi:two-component system, NarL family, nitrate/nitrite sensor histidine kinase NarX
MLSPLTGLILIVDDQPTNLEVICETLSATGLEVAIATSGERALQQIAREQPDLILLDIMMPGMDGFETCRRLKANPLTSYIPVIFMTALADTENKVKALELGAVDYVTKPFQAQEVVARVKTHLQLRRLTQETLQAAIAREQKEAAQSRAAELAKANHMLTQAVNLLATESDLDRFLDHVLKALAEQFNAPLIQYWEHPEPGDIAYLRLACRNGQILTAAELPHDCLVTGIQIPVEQNGYKNPHTRQRYLVIEDIPTDPFEQAIFSPLKFDLETWCTEHGIRKLINIALTWANKPTSSLLIYFPSGRSLSEQQIELMCALAQQATLAIQLTQLAEEAKQSALLQERTRMAREIHDTLAQAFGGISMQLQAATYFAATQPEKSQAHLQTAQALSQDGLAEARRSVWTLYLETTEYEDPSQAIAKFIEQTTSRQSVPIHLAIEGTPYCLHPDVGLNLLRIAQESIANALRHAQPQTIRICLGYSDQALQLSICDDGCGFELRSHQPGFGLLGMQQRAARMGATWQLSSQVGQGTTITVKLVNPATP